MRRIWERIVCLAVGHKYPHWAGLLQKTICLRCGKLIQVTKFNDADLQDPKESKTKPNGHEKP
jgi:hypothetical protein